jgi:hypothetical protein
MHLATLRPGATSWGARATRIRRTLAALGAAALLATTAACGDDDPVSPSARARGEYDLALIADATGQSARLPLTAEITRDGQTFVFVFESGRLELQAGDVYQLTVDVTADGAPGQITSEGTYAIDEDGVITFTEREGDVGRNFGGEVDDEGQLTVQIIGGLDFIFVRGDDT